MFHCVILTLFVDIDTLNTNTLKDSFNHSLFIPKNLNSFHGEIDLIDATNN